VTPAEYTFLGLGCFVIWGVMTVFWPRPKHAVRSFCGWCSENIGDKTGPYDATHMGICKACEEKWS
jgi:hypothetical protein